MKQHKEAARYWTASPNLQVGDPPNADEYRLNEGRVEFQPATTRKWRTLSYPEIKHHFLLGTAVGRWLTRLYAKAKISEYLTDR
jgi:hypothetical protein